MFGEKFVVRIYAWDNKGIAYIGTGYPISPTLLLTAKHVINPKNRDDSKGILIFWSEHDKKQETLPINNKTIIYEGEGQYDLAVLRCKTPLTQENTPKLSASFPQGKQDYDCCGFPKAGVRSGRRDVIPVPARIIAGHEMAHLKLIADVDMMDEAYWSGLSGAPVFVGDQLNSTVL